MMTPVCPSGIKCWLKMTVSDPATSAPPLDQLNLRYCPAKLGMTSLSTTPKHPSDSDHDYRRDDGNWNNGARVVNIRHRMVPQPRFRGQPLKKSRMEWH